LDRVFQEIFGDVFGPERVPGQKNRLGNIPVFGRYMDRHGNTSLQAFNFSSITNLGVCANALSGAFGVYQKARRFSCKPIDMLAVF
jgi:hypothetical protein